jgi:hypothetical protein
MLDPAATLAALELRLVPDATAEELVALVDEIDVLGRLLASELARGSLVPAEITRLEAVLLDVPGVRARALMAAAERYDDRGSPRRAVYVLLDALRTAFDPELVTSIAEALTFTLEAHGLTEAATRVRALVMAPRGAERRAARTRFLAELDALRADGIDWTLLDDESPLD